MFTVNIDTRAFQQSLGNLQRQFPYALSLAMNRTGEEARDRMRQQLHLSFTVRTGQSAKYLEQQVQMTERSTKDRHVVVVAARGPGAKLLARHEEGGAKSASPFFIPTEELRPFKQSVIPRSMYPKALRLDTRRDIVGKLAAKQKGKRGAFILKSDRIPRASGIYVRYGPRREDIRALWLFRRRITLKPRLKFVATVTRKWAEQFNANLRGFFDHAVRTAK